MLYLKDLLLWGSVAVHVIGMAFLFRRIFPRESRWLAFIFPEAAFVLLCNFLEHQFALTQLQLLLPVTTMGSVLAILWQGSPWRVMRLPTFLFLAAFTFAVAVRMLRPSVDDAQDGYGDLHVIADFLYGQKLPAESTWMTPFKMESYYYLAHYGASVLIRFFGVEIGTGYNLSSALLSAYIYFVAGGLAWHLSRGKLWVTILCFVLTASGSTGISGYVWLVAQNLYPDNTVNVYALFDLDKRPDIFLINHLTPIGPYGRHILLPPGYPMWAGYFHSTQTGQLLIGLFLLAMVEALRRRRSDVPWLVLAITPVMMMISCTWGMPMIAFLAVATVVAAFFVKVLPRNPGVTLALSGGLVAFLQPMLMFFLRGLHPMSFAWASDCHTEVWEFIFLWWPAYVPLLFLIFLWKRIHPVTRIVLIMAPLAFAMVETWTTGLRTDMTEKSWSIIYAATWMMFLPEIVRQRNWLCRLLVLVFVVNGVLSYCFWTTWDWRVVNRDDIGHLDGLGPFRLDPRKARVLETVSQLPGQIILPGVVTWAPDQSGLLPLFSHTRAYLSANAMDDWVYYPNALGEGGRSVYRVNDLYNGRLTNPLIFLRQHDIGAMVLYPDQQFPPHFAATLKAQLAPYYTYEDANDASDEEMKTDTDPTDPPAGVFVYHPEVTKLLGEPKDMKELKDLFDHPPVPPPKDSNGK